MNDNPKLKKNGGKGTGVGNFLRGIKGIVLPSVLKAVGLGDIAGAMGIISNDPNNAGLTKDESIEFFKLAEMEFKDRANARDNNTKVATSQNATTFSKNYVYILATVIILFVMIVTIMLFFIDIPEGNKSTIYMILGIVIGGFSAVIAYFFGTTKSSSEKNTTIQDALRK